MNENSGMFEIRFVVNLGELAELPINILVSETEGDFLEQNEDLKITITVTQNSNTR